MPVRKLVVLVSRQVRGGMLFSCLLLSCFLTRGSVRPRVRFRRHYLHSTQAENLEKGVFTSPRTDENNINSTHGSRFESVGGGVVTLEQLNLPPSASDLPADGSRVGMLLYVEGCRANAGTGVVVR